MKVIPVASPSAVQQAPSNAQAARAKAVAAFEKAGTPPATMQAAPQPAPVIVQNQSAIQPEEMGAIQASERQESLNEALDEETQVAEAPVEEDKPTEDPALSRQFAQLARQEKALRARAQQADQQLKAREAALQAREAELNSKSQQVDRTKYISRDELKADTLSILAESGISYDELTQQLVTQVPTDPRLKATISRLEAKIQEMEANNETSKKVQVEQQSQAYQAAVKQIEVDAKSLVSKDPNFETIKATNSVSDVVELITKTFNEDGILLTVEEAAQQVEDYLVEEGLKIAKLQKIQKKLQAVAPKAASITAQPNAATPQKQTQPMKTLTNNTSSTRQLSAKERAILAFKGELKS